MKIKKRIIDKWSLESKDDYQSLSDKVSFNEPNESKNRIVFKRIFFSLASVLVAFLIIIPLIDTAFDFKGGNLMDSAPGASTPDEGENKDDNVTNNAPDGDFDKSDPSTPGQDVSSDNYNSFITDLLECYINPEYVYSVMYYDLKNDNSLEITNYAGLINYFNSLKYEIFCGDMELDLEHQLMFNSDWGNIFFSDNQYVTIGFKHKYIVYETDSFNVLEDIQEFLK